MKYRKLNDIETNEYLNRYYQLKNNIISLHNECLQILERKYQQYLMDFKSTVFFLFKRTPLTFDEFITKMGSFEQLRVVELFGEKYITKALVFSADMTEELVLSDKEYQLIMCAAKYSVNIFKENNAYINRINRYASKPFELENDDFDRFESYTKYYEEINEVLKQYNTVP